MAEEGAYLIFEATRNKGMNDEKTEPWRCELTRRVKMKGRQSQRDGFGNMAGCLGAVATSHNKPETGRRAVSTATSLEQFALWRPSFGQN